MPLATTETFRRTKRWKQVRIAQLRKEPLCRICESKGILSVAEDVDHIVLVRLGGDKYNSSNLQSLCKSCHWDKTASERTGRGRRGKNWEGMDMDGRSWKYDENGVKQYLEDN